MREITNAEMLLSKMWRGDSLHQLCCIDSGERIYPIVVASIDEAITKANQFNIDKGFDVYFACAEFITGDNRKAANALGAWGYWFDIDCGADKAAKGEGYPTKKDAKNALIGFIKQTNLPYPDFIVDSGNGLHVYFCSDEFIQKDDWLVGARKLKGLTKHYGLLVDQTRTADIASILRFPNTKNYKDPLNPKAVKVVYPKGGEA